MYTAVTLKSIDDHHVGPNTANDHVQLAFLGHSAGENGPILGEFW